jgi:hypothetical protein
MCVVKEVTTLEIVEIDEYEWTAMIDDIQEVEIDMEDIIQEVAQEAIPDRDREEVNAVVILDHQDIEVIQDTAVVTLEDILKKEDNPENVLDQDLDHILKMKKKLLIILI